MILLSDCICIVCQKHYDATLEHPYYTKCPECKAKAEQHAKYVEQLSIIQE